MADLIEFLALIEKAIKVAENTAQVSAGTEEDWMASDASMAARHLREIAEQARSGELPPSDGAGLGITRAFSEWAPKELYDAGKAVEDYYREKWQ